MSSVLKYEVEQYIIGTREDDHDSRFTVRRNGKAFYITVSPSNFVNSPTMTKTYLSYLEVLRSGEEVLGEIFETDVYEWVMAPFEPFFAEHAPAPPELSKDFGITLQEHLFPDFYVLVLDIVDEKFVPRRVAAKKSPHRPSFVRFDDDLLDDLETWTALYDPANIILSFEDPEDALFRPPRKVLINNRQTECFFKPCGSGSEIKRELNAYKMIQAAGLDSLLHLCHLHGVVIDDKGFILGLLLSYVDCEECPLAFQIHPDEPDDPPREAREKWADQLDATLTALHRAGIVWGDVKAENVLIGKDDNAYMIDFGGGYTEGWVDEKVAGTVEGDLMGMAKLKEFLIAS